jgi:hypothetical protein
MLSYIFVTSICIIYIFYTYTLVNPSTGACDSRWGCPGVLTPTPFEVHLWNTKSVISICIICICYAYKIADPNTGACDSIWECPGGPLSPFSYKFTRSSFYSGLSDIYSNLYLKNYMTSSNVWTSRFFLSLKFCINKGTTFLNFCIFNFI